MSQHDYIIDNQSRSSFRAELNLMLAAILSQNSGATAPSTTTPYMFWPDTANDVLKQRNAADSVWISLFTLSTGEWIGDVAGNAATAAAALIATVANRVDSGEVTITGHATNGDIFAATANSILFDDSGGAITVTAIPAAAKAGMVRDIRYNGTTKYTASANLLIEGIPNGTTVTLAAGATAQIRAITTTQFKMTYSVSGSFTITGTGFSANPTGTALYLHTNGFVCLKIPSLSGTSNATTFSLTGIPPELLPASQHHGNFVSGLDNSATSLLVLPVITTTTIDLYTGKTGFDAWTATGTKQLRQTTLTYSTTI